MTQAVKIEHNYESNLFNDDQEAIAQSMASIR